MPAETLDADPCLVGGLLVAGAFGRRGVVIRDGFQDHPKVLRWRAKHGHPAITILASRDFDNLIHDALRW